MIIKSKRLEIRFVNKSDLKLIHNLLILPETDRFNTLGLPKNLEVTKSFSDEWMKSMQKERIINYTFTILDKQNGKFIGLFGLNLGRKIYKSGEVWYKLYPKFWGKGFATESLNCMLNFCLKDLKLHRIEAGCAVDNIASYKVMEKAGMIKEGRCRKVLPLENGWSDTFEYAILDTDRS